MGEWSKLVGEFGEERVSNLLELIGWKNLLSNYDIPCSLPEKHGNQEKRQHRREHGLDGTLLYDCPLFDATQQHLVVSVKYSADPYPSGSKLGQKFGEHYRGLSEMCVCYEKSASFGQLTQATIAAGHFPVSGVLFWLNNCSQDDNTSICPLLVSTRPEAVPNIPVYLVDNNQASFLYDSVAFMRRNFGESFSFNYQSTGKNLDARSRRHQGRLLPIHMLNASQLAFRVETEGKALVICSKSTFSEPEFKRLCDLAQYLTQGWAAKVLFAFRAFNWLEHREEVTKVKQIFSQNDGLKNIEVYALEDDFRNQSAK